MRELNNEVFELAIEELDAVSGGAPKNNDVRLFEIDDFSFDIEQTLNIGSQSSGAGAGK